MTSQEIEMYVKTHGGIVKNAIRSIKVRLTPEELEDASQELYETMLHCLGNYDPKYKTPIDSYVNASLYSRARGIVYSHFAGARGRDNMSKSLSDIVPSNGEYVQLVDTLCDDVRSFEDICDYTMLSDYVLSRVDNRSRDMLVAWSQGISVSALSKEMGISVPWAWELLQIAMSKAKSILEGDDVQV